MHTGAIIEQNPPVADVVIIVIIFLIPILIIIIAAIAGFIRRRRNRANIGKQTDNRMNVLADWAKSRGLSFHPDSDINMESRFWFFDSLKTGPSHYGYNIMEGVISNRKVCAFDYLCEWATVDKSGNRRVGAQSYLSAVIVETSAYFRPLFIRPEKFRDKIAASAGVEDIDFESAEFNSQFYVRASDHRWAYDAVNQANMELLLSHCRFNIEFNGKYVIAYRDELFELGHFEEALQLLTGIIDNLPKTLFGKEKGEKLWS